LHLERAKEPGRDHDIKDEREVVRERRRSGSSGTSETDDARIRDITRRDGVRAERSKRARTGEAGRGAQRAPGSSARGAQRPWQADRERCELELGDGEDAGNPTRNSRARSPSRPWEGRRRSRAPDPSQERSPWPDREQGEQGGGTAGRDVWRSRGPREHGGAQGRAPVSLRRQRAGHGAEKHQGEERRDGAARQHHLGVSLHRRQLHLPHGGRSRNCWIFYGLGPFIE
jgi:hypothetical protein